MPNKKSKRYRGRRSMFTVKQLIQAEKDLLIWGRKQKKEKSILDKKLF